MRKHLGFTLLEVIIVMVALSIIAAASAQLLIAGGEAFSTSVNIIHANWQGQLALERMERDIRNIRSSSDISTATASALTFTDADGNNIAYALSGGNITLNGNILADSINSLTFTYYDENGTAGPATANIRYIKIAINVATSEANYSLTTTAYPRNLP